MQDFISGPSLMAGVAGDNTIPLLRRFKAVNGDPKNALLLCVGICGFSLLVGDLNVVASLCTMTFLVTYGFTNTACFLRSFLDEPNWRPRFHYYNIFTALFGLVSCFGMMMVISPIAAIVSFFAIGGLYRYVQHVCSEASWGDGITGLKFQRARNSLLALNHMSGSTHAKNWRPQLLVFLRPTDDLEGVMEPEILRYASHLKKGKGLIVVTSVFEGDYITDHPKVKKLDSSLSRFITNAKVEAFYQALSSPSIREGLLSQIQSAGISGLRPNTLLMGYPDRWRDSEDSLHIFFDCMKAALTADQAVLVLRDRESYPTAPLKSGTIDVWWVTHDGGLMLLLPFLQHRHLFWKGCTLRVFVVAQEHDNSVKIAQDLKQLLFDLRFDAEIKVVEIESSIAPYSFQRTLRMKDRGIADDLAALRATAAATGTTTISLARVGGTDSEGVSATPSPDLTPEPPSPSPSVHVAAESSSNKEDEARRRPAPPPEKPADLPTAASNFASMFKPLTTQELSERHDSPKPATRLTNLFQPPTTEEKNNSTKVEDPQPASPMTPKGPNNKEDLAKAAAGLAALFKPPPTSNSDKSDKESDDVAKPPPPAASHLSSLFHPPAPAEKKSTEKVEEVNSPISKTPEPSIKGPDLAKAASNMAALFKPPTKEPDAPKPPSSNLSSLFQPPAPTDKPEAGKDVPKSSNLANMFQPPKEQRPSVSSLFNKPSAAPSGPPAALELKPVPKPAPSALPNTTPSSTPSPAPAPPGKAPAKADSHHGPPRSLLRMNNAIRFNELIKKYSPKASMIYLTLPRAREGVAASEFLEYLDAMTEGIPVCVLVRGSGHEVVTMFS